MIIRPFREHHMLLLLQNYEQQPMPLDLLISMYFRNHQALGPKDRSVIAETIYAMVRWKSLLDHLCQGTPTWEKRLEIFSRGDLEQAKRNPQLPLHIRCSFPENLFALLVKSHGEKLACELCRISNQAAPTTIRTNSLKVSRTALFEKWKSQYDISCCAHAEHGITFHKKINFFALPEFKQGLFEVQDEGSQLLSNLVQVQAGQLVMDYCAGSGGKTLAFAPRMNGSGQIFLHDIRSHALLEARKRLRRAGIQNAQVIQAEDPKLKKLKKKMDWVLVDAPCSGTGTMRRNPDMKWNFTEETLVRLLGQQRVIFERALSFMKPSGRIIYATCSILQEENDDQLAHFLKTYGLQIEGEIFRSLPAEGLMDGFFAVTLKKIEEI